MDAKAISEEAIGVAKQQLVEQLAPAIKNLVGSILKESSEYEDIDRLNRSRDGRGETEFEENVDIKGDNEMAKEKEKDLEKESLDAMFPGISEMEGEEEEMATETADQDEDDMGQMERRIPTLGEGEEGEGEEEDEGDMDEEISISPAGLRKAYEAVMKTNKALKEVDVSSGFKDSAKSTEWNTEDSPPTDRGLSDKEKVAAWEEEEPKAAQDYQVKEAIEKGLKENTELRRYVEHLESQYSRAVGVIRKLKEQISEVNLFNQKVVHVNELFHKFGLKNLTKEQRDIVIKKIDEAITVREVKMVAEALRASFKSSQSISESRTRRPKADASKRTTSGSPNQKVLRESVDNSPREQYARMRELAGIVGSK